MYKMQITNKPEKKKQCVSVCYAVVLSNQVIVRCILKVLVAVKSISLVFTVLKYGLK